jgi:hypothetical protein
MLPMHALQGHGTVLHTVSAPQVVSRGIGLEPCILTVLVDCSCSAHSTVAAVEQVVGDGACMHLQQACI